MQPGDALEQYCMKMERTYHYHKDNMATVEEFHVIKQLVKGIPAELDEVKIALHAKPGWEASQLQHTPFLCQLPFRTAVLSPLTLVEPMFSYVALGHDASL